MKSTKYTVFGWEFNKNTFVDGEEVAAIFPKDTPMDNSANWLFWTKGSRVAISYPQDFNDEFFIEQRGRFLNKTTFAGHTYKRGKYVFQVVGDTEVWCLDCALNGGNLPNLDFVALDVGQTYTTSIGQLILVASGETNLGSELTCLEIVSENKVITATTDAFLIIFSGRK